MVERTRSLARQESQDEARDYLLSDPATQSRDGGKPVLDRIREKAIEAQRWACILYAEIVGWTGTKQAVLNMLVMQLGVPVEEARQAVDTVLRAPKDPHEIAHTCRDYLAWYDGPNGPSRDATAERSA